MNILITGGCGFIGSNLTNRLVKLNHTITVIDDLSTGKIAYINSLSSIDLIELDIRKSDSIEQILKKKQIDIIIHLAAIASVQKSKDNPILANEINFLATIKLLELAVKNNIKQFIFASSAAVYGDNQVLPKHETSSTIAPISTYGIDKYASEQYVMNYARGKRINGVAFRFFNVFGPNQDPASPYSGVLSLFLNSVINSDKPEVTIFGNGKQTRDFIYINDVVSAIEYSLENENLSGHIFNLATGVENSLLRIIDDLELISSKKIEINFKANREGDIFRSVADIGKIIDFGFKPRYNFKDSLKEYFDHLRSNR